jgi:hypothetical protein
MNATILTLFIDFLVGSFYKSFEENSQYKFDPNRHPKSRFNFSELQAHSLIKINCPWVKIHRQGQASTWKLQQTASDLLGSKKIILLHFSMLRLYLFGD